MSMLEKSGRPAAVVYASDHGEDILDDDRERFLHASPTPTYYQLHVAMLTWVSDSYNSRYPDKLAALESHSDTPVSSTSSLFNTLLELAGIETPWLDKSLSVASFSYTRPTPLYLDDDNDGITLDISGLKKEDMQLLEQFSLL